VEKLVIDFMENPEMMENGLVLNVNTVDSVRILVERVEMALGDGLLRKERRKSVAAASSAFMSKYSSSPATKSGGHSPEGTPGGMQSGSRRHETGLGIPGGGLTATKSHKHTSYFRVLSEVRNIATIEDISGSTALKDAIAAAANVVAMVKNYDPDQEMGRLGWGRGRAMIFRSLYVAHVHVR
jgi:hypothetical protein